MNGFGTERRLERLDLILQPIGCPNCRRWTGTVLCDDHGAASRPETCPNCKRVVLAVERVYLHDIRLEDI